MTKSVDLDKIEKESYIRAEKEKIFKQLRKYPGEMVAVVHRALTGREDYHTANLFCLSLILNLVRRIKSKGRI